MTSERRFEHDLPELLGQLALGPTPDYRIDIVQQTARMRQRPAWTFPERWLPMTAVTSRVAVARIPWRIIALAALLLLALVAGAVFLIGSQPRLPAPFGPAANGHVAYSANGDIYTVDPLSAAATSVVTGPETDREPVFSRDGTHLLFERVAYDAYSGFGQLFVARANGSELTPITPQPYAGLANYAFSPDGREVVFTAAPLGNTELWIAKADGSGVRKVEVGMGVVGPVYRPPNGAEIVFVGQSPIAAGNGIYAVNAATGKVRTILAPSAGVGRDFVRAAPDGSRIAYSASTVDPDRNTYRIHVVSIDGTGDLVLPMPKGATFQDAPEWSNDSTRLVIVRGYATRNQDIVLAVVPADGTDVGVETKHGLTGCCDTANEWAPDDTSILTTPFDLSGQPLRQILWNPRTGVTSPAPWVATSKPAWQRRAS